MSIPGELFYAKPTASSSFKLKMPMPLPSDTLPILHTPISLKTSGCDTYDSGSHLRHKLLAMETEGHYLGSMPALQFINFFPTAGLVPVESGTTTFAAVISNVVKCEADMYDPFVSCPLLIICTTLNKKSYSQITAAKQFSPSLTFANTHSNGDPECDDLATDVSGYKSTDLPSNPGKADFAKMDLFAEFKFDANADPLH